MSRARSQVAGLVLALALGLAGACAPAPAGPTGATNPTEASTLTVFAASSLTDAFGEIGRAFGRTRPGLDLRFNFGSSSSLAAQVLDGAPGDVFASADQATMARVVSAGATAGEAQVFAGNVLELAVPAGNPGKVGELGDLGRPELAVGLCAEEVPCGRLARRLLAQAGVVASVDTNEADVRSLLTKVEAGELDAGLVYRSDVTAAGSSVEGIEVAGSDQVVTEYPIAVLAGSAAPGQAQDFVDFVASGPGQHVLAAQGFLGR